MHIYVILSDANIMFAILHMPQDKKNAINLLDSSIK